MEDSAVAITVANVVTEEVVVTGEEVVIAEAVVTVMVVMAVRVVGRDETIGDNKDLATFKFSNFQIFKLICYSRREQNTGKHRKAASVR